MTMLYIDRLYANGAQHSHNIERILHVARGAMGIAGNVRADYPDLAQKYKVRAYAYLNRACELACVPLHQRIVDTAQGTETAWYTYCPRACDVGSLSEVACFVGYVDQMDEQEARSRALGW